VPTVETPPLAGCHRWWQIAWAYSQCDAYPGIKPVTLMELMDPSDPRRLEVLPVVTYAVKRLDHATLIEPALEKRARG
jgi:hypothetical protein